MYMGIKKRKEKELYNFFLWVRMMYKHLYQTLQIFSKF
jgi:hypothetical protein